MLLTSGLLVAATVSTWAIDKAELDKRIRLLTTKLQNMQEKGDKRIPAETLKKAQGIVLLDRTKAGFIFAYAGGSGVGMVKTRSGNWSAPAFYKANEASLGFQIGGQQSFMVILLMNTNATKMLTETKVDFGGEASGTAGDASAEAEGRLPNEAQIQVYDDRIGLYGGAAIKGGGIVVDENANLAYYDQAVSPRDILFGGKVKTSDAAAELMKAINSAAKSSGK